MTLSGRERSKLNRIIKLAKQLIEIGGRRAVTSQIGRSQRANGKKSRVRRTGRELARFRKMLKAERRKGVPVAALARKHGISTAYIYLLR